MSLCALVGIAATLAFITVSWPGETGRYVFAIVIAAGLGLMASASIALLSAARHTYVRRGDENEPKDE